MLHLRCYFSHPDRVAAVDHRGKGRKELERRSKLAVVTVQKARNEAYTTGAPRILDRMQLRYLRSLALLYHPGGLAYSFPVHGVLLEDTVEHIRRINLRTEISVVTSIISTDQMTKRSLAIALITLHSQSFWAFETCDLRAKIVVESGEFESFSIGMGLGCMDCHIKDAEVEWAEVEQSVVDVLNTDLLPDEVVRNLLAA